MRAGILFLTSVMAGSLGVRVQGRQRQPFACLLQRMERRSDLCAFETQGPLSDGPTGPRRPSAKVASGSSLLFLREREATAVRRASTALR